MNRILVVVDYQNDFVYGALGFAGAERLEKPIMNKIKSYLDRNDKVFFTLDTHESDYLKTREGKFLPVEHCIDQSEGWHLYGELKKYHTDNRVIVVKKPSFGSLSLLENIAKVCPDADSIEICGLVTNLCVISNAVLLQNKFPNADIIIDEKCCDSYDKSLHEKAIDVMRGMQMTIKSE